ncbi:MAG: FAD-dependent oxidoreductase [Candidatus Cloacimonetes bacterium]|nr:FAD-dependent oxidoreductase [Candidatus Cloacimonadota bacterium]MCF7813442.1 FAD-dependent oxidoreductase [Candidatus Cloacimonadota bacterium]MCF7867735.1 FAD-dependent oxidoreductase [Candidatus Cloacimonadota bacterium]MCF7883179.1 FAD-dependent oxidoreductase [Candidatus Cloacimonadota bacterium]
MYPKYMMESIKMVEKTRPKRLELAKKLGKEVFPGMTEQERKEVLDKYHPDYQSDALRELRIGPNKGEKMVNEVVDIMESYPRNHPDTFDLDKIEIETDVLIIGAGSAGLSAAIEASNGGAEVTLVTKLRLGDSNSMMAQGGIQAADQLDDNPTLHYLDVIGGGHFDNKPELVEALVKDAAPSIKWLEDLGVMFDKNSDGSMMVKSGGGTCRNRMHSARDYTGAAICRVLRDEVQNRPEKINFIEYTSATELILDNKGNCAGAILYHMENKQFSIVKAKSVIIATGGFGRLHVRGFETTNHYGATADGLVMGYRAGAKLMYMDSVQYHPTGAVFPEQIVGFLCTEKIRGLGAQPVNKDGELFVYPLEPRDIEASAFIRECDKGLGVETPSGLRGIWLDSPLIELLVGEGTIERYLPAMLRQYKRFDIDITKYPMLVYPTLHYQNGGLEIDANAETSIPGLFVAGEASGGVHGRNRLMGNSQLDIVVFGRRAGTNAAAKVKKGVKLGKMSLKHVEDYIKEVDKLGIDKKKISPVILPDYIPDHVKAKQLATEYQGTLI